MALKQSTSQLCPSMSHFSCSGVISSDCQSRRSGCEAYTEVQQGDLLLAKCTMFFIPIYRKDLEQIPYSRGMGMPLEPEEVDNPPGHNSQTALYESHGPAIFGYLRLHMRSLEDAEDLLLEVFLAALEHNNIAASSPGEQLAWLRRVAHNKLLNVYRRAGRNPQVPLDSIMEPIFEEEDPEKLTLQREERSQLRASIQKLPALQQYILQLRYGDGLRCSEIALLLNKREGAVRKLLSRSILFLRQIYQQSEGESTC
jgi:RNA polymerase sigma factor (sigma-70 family)